MQGLVVNLLMFFGGKLIKRFMKDKYVKWIDVASQVYYQVENISDNWSGNEKFERGLKIFKNVCKNKGIEEQDASFIYSKIVEQLAKVDNHKKNIDKKK
jgi:hypothetical protein